MANEGLEKSNNILNVTIQTQSAKIAELKSENKGLSKQVTDLKSKVEELNGTITTLRDSEDKAKLSAAELKGELKVAAEQTQKFKNEVLDLQNQLSKFGNVKTTISDLTSQLNEARTQSQLLQEQYDELRMGSGIDRLQQKISDYETGLYKSSEELLYWAQLKHIPTDDGTFDAYYNRVAEGSMTVNEAQTALMQTYQEYLQLYSQGDEITKETTNSMLMYLDKLSQKYDILLSKVEEIQTVGVKTLTPVDNSGVVANTTNMDNIVSSNLTSFLEQLNKAAQATAESTDGAVSPILNLINALNSFGQLDEGKLTSIQSSLLSISNFGKASFKIKSLGKVGEVIGQLQRINDTTKLSEIASLNWSNLSNIKVSKAALSNLALYLPQISNNTDVEKLKEIDKLTFKNFANLNTQLANKIKSQIENQQYRIKDIKLDPKSVSKQPSGVKALRDNIQNAINGRSYSITIDKLSIDNALKVAKKQIQQMFGPIPKQPQQPAQPAQPLVPPTPIAITSTGDTIDDADQAKLAMSFNVFGRNVSRAMMQLKEADFFGALGDEMRTMVSESTAYAKNIENAAAVSKTSNDQLQTWLAGTQERFTAIQRDLAVTTTGMRQQNEEQKAMDLEISKFDVQRAKAINSIVGLQGKLANQQLKVDGFTDQNTFTQDIQDVFTKLTALKDVVKNVQFGDSEGLNKAIALTIEYSNAITELTTRIAQFSQTDGEAQAQQLESSKAREKQMLLLSRISKLEGTLTNQLTTVGKFQDPNTFTRDIQDYMAYLAQLRSSITSANLADPLQLSTLTGDVTEAGEAIQSLGNAITTFSRTDAAFQKQQQQDANFETKRLSLINRISQLQGSLVKQTASVGLLKDPNNFLGDIEGLKSYLQDLLTMVQSIPNGDALQLTTLSNDIINTSTSVQTLDNQIKEFAQTDNALGKEAAKTSYFDKIRTAALKNVATLQNELTGYQNKISKFAGANTFGDDITKYRTDLSALFQDMEAIQNGDTATLDKLTARTTRYAIALKQLRDEISTFAANDANTGDPAVKLKSSQLSQVIGVDNKIKEMLTYRNNNTKLFGTKDGTELNGYIEKMQQLREEALSSSNATRRSQELLGTQIKENVEGFNNFTLRMKVANKEGQTLFTKLGQGIKKFAGWTVITRTIMSIRRFFSALVKNVKEVDTAMTQFKIVTQQNTGVYNRFAENITKKSKEIGASITDMIDSATTFARLGYSVNESSELATYTSMLSKVGDVEVKDAQSAVTAITKAYDDIDADNIESTMDKLVKVGKQCCPAA